MEHQGQPKLIVLDSAPATAQQIRQIADLGAEILATDDVRAALGWIKSDPAVALILVAQSIAGTPGVSILEAARRINPQVRRVLITEGGNLPLIFTGFHQGAISRLISKPILKGDILSALAAGPDATEGPQRATA